MVAFAQVALKYALCHYLKPQRAFIEADGKILIEFNGGKNKVLTISLKQLICSSVLM